MRLQGWQKRSESYVTNLKLVDILGHVGSPRSKGDRHIKDSRLASNTVMPIKQTDL